MTILERYLFKRAVTFAAASLASLVSIVWIVQALSRIDIVKTSASAAGNIFWIALMLLPDLTAGVMPFAVLIGAIQALNSLNTDAERPVIAASGASQLVVAKPIFLLGLGGGLLMLFIAHVIGPASANAFQNGLRSINADTITLFLQPGRFEQVQPGLVVSIGAARGSTVEGLVIADTRDDMTELTYFAREAKILRQDDQSLLLLYDGQLHRQSKSDGGLSVIEFQTYAFDLAELKPAARGDWIRASERSTLALVRPDPNDPIYQSRPQSLTEELTDRMTNWLYALAFALWAVVVAGQPRTNRQGTGPAMALGLAGGLGLKALGFVSLSLIDESFIWVWVTYALPIGAIVLSGTLILRDFNLSRWFLFEKVADAWYRVGSAAARRMPFRQSARSATGQ